MWCLSILFCLLLSGCAQMIPGLTQALDDAVTDEAVSVTVDKSAIGHDGPDIDITLKVSQKNKTQ